MPPDPSSTQEVEMAHLMRLASTHPNWIDYCQWNARKLALKYPLEYASLPLLLSSALKQSTQRHPSIGESSNS
jgi:hypothetical protein